MNWKKTGWRKCDDITIRGVVEGSPRYFRCFRCYRVVTHGQTALGGCACGFRKLLSCLELTTTEIILLKLGWFPLAEYEHEFIRPLFPWLARKIRPRLFWALK